jgi:hypothetical protein
MAKRSNNGECSRTQAFFMPVASQGLLRRNAAGFISTNGTSRNVLVVLTANIFKLKVTQAEGQGMFFFFSYMFFAI